MYLDRKKTDIKIIIMHCSGSDLKEHDNIEAIRSWHKARGWKDIGYHFLITKDGMEHHGRSVLTTGAHCLKHNMNSIGVCLTGNRVFTIEQFKTARVLVENLMREYNIPLTKVYPHHYFDSLKTCPNYMLSSIFPGYKLQK